VSPSGNGFWGVVNVTITVITFEYCLLTDGTLDEEIGSTILDSGSDFLTDLLRPKLKVGVGS
jgi:hypothetical protein